jgi:tetratricopeptide (TPR) repeat protein
MRLYIALLLTILLIQPAMADAIDDAAKGSTAYREGRLQDAINSLTKAIDAGQLKGGDLALALNNRAVVWDAMGQADKAISDYERALTLRADDERLRANLVLVLLRRGDGEVRHGDAASAMRDYDRAVALAPKSVPALKRRGSLRLAQGDRAGAKSDLEQVKALAPDDGSIQQMLARATGAADNSAAPAGATAAYRVVRAVNVRGGPDTGAAVLGVLKEGEVVDVVGETNGWLALRMDDGTIGYAYGSYLQRQ